MSNNDEPDVGRRPVHYSKWPTIKLFYMPKGRLSQTPDERCISYCSQNVNGRIEHRSPWCRSLCLRRVFAHEVRNVLGYNRHLDARADGTAKYPLPLEGQVREEVPDETITIAGRREPLKLKDPDAETLFWEEGWYLWYSRSQAHSLEHLDLMGLSVPSQMRYLEYLKGRRDKWTRSQKTGIPLEPEPVAAPLMDESSVSTLIRLNTPYEPLSQALENYLKPTYTLMETVKTTFQDGSQARFAKEVWETARTQEPYRLVKNVFAKMSELWNSDGTDEDDDES